MTARTAARSTPPPPEFSRKFIPNDVVTPPFLSSGWERKFYLFMYTAICCSSWAGVLYVGSHDVSLLAISLVAGYFANNLGFAVMHTILHMQFIEQPEQEMYRLTHHSFIHHYRDVHVYHKTWLETRLSYFFDGRTPWRVIASAQTWHWFLMMPIAAMKLSPTPLHAVSVMSTFCLMEQLQSVCHEWYHVPEMKRKMFYWTPTYLLLSSLENMGILNTDKHKIHHRHNINQLDDVHEWTDMWSIGFDRVAHWVFQKAKTLYVPGEERMFRSMDPVIGLTAISVNCILQSGVWMHYKYMQ